MIIGKVTGNIISTVRAVGYDSKTILIVQPIDPSGKETGKTLLAIDTVQAGVGDTVLVLEEGGSARLAIQEPNTFTVKACVVGIVDHISKGV